MGKAANRKRARRYSDDDRASALAAVAANGGNVSKTARELGIKVTTLRQWKCGERHPEAIQMSQGKKLPLADAIETVVDKMVAAVAGKIDDASLQQLATSIGILTDKMLLLRGGNSGEKSGDDAAKVLSTIEAYIAARQPQPGGAGGGPGDGSPGDTVGGEPGTAGVGV
jgi:hypothetical protein